MKKIYLLFFLIALVSGKVSALTIEEKVGQMLLVHFHGTSSNAISKKLIKEAHVGGFIFYRWANELISPDQVKELTTSLQENSPTLLLFAIDQEGGRVANLREGFTTLPSNRSVGQSNDANLAKHYAVTIGKEMKEVGINMNLAPVVDVDSNPENPVIGDRSFGNDAEVVVRFAKEAISGYKESKIIAVIKHFPGHGDTHTDSHETLPILENFPKSHLEPFKQLAPLVPAIMSAHIKIPSIDEQPATLSYKILTELLRDQYDFKGVILSDSLIMKGIRNHFETLSEVAIMAIQAGCDILILGGAELNGMSVEYELSPQEVIEIHHSIVKAVKEGKISENRINESISRIEQLKENIDG